MSEKVFAVVGEFHSAVGFKVICATLEMMNFSNLYFQTEVIMCCCVSDPLLRRYVAAPALSPREQRPFPQPVFQGRKELWPGAKGPGSGPSGPSPVQGFIPGLPAQRWHEGAVT